MPRLKGKIALTAGGTLLAGALLVVVFVSGGVMVLSFLLTAVFLVGGAGVVSQGLFVPLLITSTAVCALAWWALSALGVGAFWLWKRKLSAAPPPDDKAS